jgi:hypothetical protein
MWSAFSCLVWCDLYCRACQGIFRGLPWCLRLVHFGPSVGNGHSQLGSATSSARDKTVSSHPPSLVPIASIILTTTTTISTASLPLDVRRQISRASQSTTVHPESTYGAPAARPRFPTLLACADNIVGSAAPQAPCTLL